MVVAVVVVVTVVVVVVVVVISRPYPTVPGQMANPLAIIAPRWTRTFMIVITLRTQRFGPGVWFPVTIACSVGLCCKQTIAKRTYFGNIDPFIQNTIEGNFGPQISKLNADLEQFHLCLKEEMVADLRYFNSLKHEVDTLKSQLETQKTQFLNEIDRLLREYYYADHMNAILGVGK
ncbi:hypothetical protein Tco_0248750 [Tanacetum coccineum]